MKSSECAQDYLSRVSTKNKAFQVKGDSSSKGIVESSNFRGNNRSGHRGRGRGRVVPYNVNTARSMDIEMLIVRANRKASNTVPILTKLQRRDYLRPILLNASNKENNAWYIDSGCSKHMCGAGSMFKELDESQRKEMTLGNDWKMKVEGKVILQLKPHNVMSDFSIMLSMFLL
ncbi:hypothetical protein Tco_0323545 [Tanacetum coccineum]